MKQKQEEDEDSPPSYEDEDGPPDLGDPDEEDGPEVPGEFDDFCLRDDESSDDNEPSGNLNAFLVGQGYAASPAVLPTPLAYSSYWATAPLQPDLIILEDEGFWDEHGEEHKIAAATCSFSFARNMDDTVIDVSLLENLPSVNDALYLTNGWHQWAEHSEIHDDIKNLPRAEQDALFASLRAVGRPKGVPKRKAARREATAQEKRVYAKQFVEAKKAEFISWSKENDVYDMVDLRKTKVKNYITGRWVLTVKRDKNGNFEKCKARWVLRGFQDRQVWELQTDSPTGTRPGFRLQFRFLQILAGT